MYAKKSKRKERKWNIPYNPKGANKQEIFHEDDDHVRFIEILGRYKKVSNIKVHGWCLMGNHVHILIEQGNEDLAVTMKRIGVSYARYYNWKYNITGHLFQDRYRSEKVENDEYLLTVIRYIHQNPVKAGIVKRFIDWKWSSCNGYYGHVVYPAGLLDSELILGMFSEDRETAIKRFIEFNEAESAEECLEYSNKRLTDEEAKREIFKIIPFEEVVLIKSMPKAERDKLILRIKGNISTSGSKDSWCCT